MNGHAADLTYPNCCAVCPYRQPLTAACTHDLRQSLIRELSLNEACPVYSETKTTAMRELVDGA